MNSHNLKSHIQQGCCSNSSSSSTVVVVQGAHRRVKVVFHDFQDDFTCIFQQFLGSFVHFHVFPGLFSWVDIKQVRFSYTFTKSINRSTKHVANYNYTKQQIKACLTVDNGYATQWICKGRKHVHRSKMQQRFGSFSMTFQDLAPSSTFLDKKLWTRKFFSDSPELRGEGMGIAPPACSWWRAKYGSITNHRSGKTAMWIGKRYQ